MKSEKGHSNLMYGSRKLSRRNKRREFTCSENRARAALGAVAPKPIGDGVSERQLNGYPRTGWSTGKFRRPVHWWHPRSKLFGLVPRYVDLDLYRGHRIGNV